MMITERRRSPRMTLKYLAYIDIEPANGGILLNISEGGVSFQSAVPLQPAAMIRFSFSYGSHRIEANGRLAWTDDTRKRGGLRFTNLSAVARKEICDWIGQHAVPVADGHGFAPSPSPSPEFPSATANQQNNIAPRRNSTLLAAYSPHTPPPRLLTGFSGGLVSGILISSALVAVLLLFQNYRREFGESLIHLGERLGGGSHSAT